jgi:hypothetical protein
MIWKTGADGGAVAIMADPECENSGDIKPVTIHSQRWDEAMANIDLIVTAVNSHAALIEALEETLLCLKSWSAGRGPHDATTSVVERAESALAAAKGGADGR